MDTHHFQSPQHQPEPTPTVGPRQAAARSRKKRTMILTLATTSALVVGGTATAALITSNTPPPSLAHTAQIPNAEPDELPAEHSTPQGQAEQAQQATQAGVQSTSTQGTNLAQEEEQPQQEPDTSTQEPDTSTDQDPEPTGQGGTCEASFYGADLAGSATANGETFDPNAMTAAHKTLPFDTNVQVTNPGNGQSVTVRINDRGPFVAGRCLDLSTAAFDQIIGTGSGVGQVEWQVVD